MSGELVRYRYVRLLSITLMARLLEPLSLMLLLLLLLRLKHGRRSCLAYVGKCDTSDVDATENTLAVFSSVNSGCAFPTFPSQMRVQLRCACTLCHADSLTNHSQVQRIHQRLEPLMRCRTDTNATLLDAETGHQALPTLLLFLFLFLQFCYRIIKVLRPTVIKLPI